MSFQKFFEDEFRKTLYDNLEEVVERLKNNTEMQDKVRRYADKWGLTEDEVRQAIFDRNPYALRAMCVDPGRQNISERTQAAYNGITLLNNRNPHKWTAFGTTTKTIDGKLNDRFVFMKVIRQHGGQQEDVKREAEEFIRIVNNTNDKFIVLIDDFTKPDLTRYTKLVNNHEQIWVMNSDMLKERLI